MTKQKQPQNGNRLNAFHIQHSDCLSHNLLFKSKRQTQNKFNFEHSIPKGTERWRFTRHVNMTVRIVTVTCRYSSSLLCLSQNDKNDSFNGRLHEKSQTNYYYYRLGMVISRTLFKWLNPTLPYLHHSILIWMIYLCVFLCRQKATNKRKQTFIHFISFRFSLPHFQCESVWRQHNFNNPKNVILNDRQLFMFFHKALEQHMCVCVSYWTSSNGNVWCCHFCLPEISWCWCFLFIHYFLFAMRNINK